MTAGMVIGKFMPPHKGHKFLIEFASQYCDELVVVVCHTHKEPINGSLRYQWMKSEFECKNITVVSFPNDLPQEPSESENFWPLWRKALSNIFKRETSNHHIRYIFASESYGIRLAKELQASFVPCNIDRTLNDISGTRVRDDLVGNWDMLIRPAKAFYAKRVALYGAESTGKTTLAQALANRFDTKWCPEYARLLIDAKKCDPYFSMMDNIVQGHINMEETLALDANKVLFSDTTPLTTMVWSDYFFNFSSSYVRDMAERKYSLLLIPNDDIPFVPDPQRYGGDHRQLNLDTFMKYLTKMPQLSNQKYVILNGSHEERMNQAIFHVNELIKDIKI